MRDIEPAGGCQYHSLKSTRRWLSLYLVTVCPTRNLSRRFSPAVFKAEIKLSGERVAARFACGAESLAVYRAVYKYIASRCRRGATKARFPLPHVRQITSICSRAGHVTFPRVSLTGILELDTLSSIIYSCYKLSNYPVPSSAC